MRVTEFAPLVATEVVGGDLSEIDLPEPQWLPVAGGLGHVVDSVDEDTEPLVTGTVGVDRTALLQRRLDLDALRARLDGVIGIDALHDQVRMSVVVPVLDQSAGVGRQARGLQWPDSSAEARSCVS